MSGGVHFLNHFFITCLECTASALGRYPHEQNVYGYCTVTARYCAADETLFKVLLASVVCVIMCMNVSVWASLCIVIYVFVAFYLCGAFC